MGQFEPPLEPSQAITTFHNWAMQIDTRRQLARALISSSTAGSHLYALAGCSSPAASRQPWLPCSLPRSAASKAARASWQASCLGEGRALALALAVAAAGNAELGLASLHCTQWPLLRWPALRAAASLRRSANARATHALAIAGQDERAIVAQTCIALRRTQATKANEKRTNLCYCFRIANAQAKAKLYCKAK